jgi:hypothetical protein
VFVSVEIWKDWMILTDTIDEMISNCDMIDGHPFMKLLYVIQAKTHMARPKDIDDLRLIQTYIEQSQS